MIKKLKQLVFSSRPISWINTGFPFTAAYLFTSQEIGVYFWVTALFFLVPYNFLIYVTNDVFDYESDVRNPRKNSIEGGLLPPETHKFMLVSTTIFNAPFILYVLSKGDAKTNALFLLIIFGAISYSIAKLRFKERPFLDSINSSFHFVSPAVFALVLGGWQSSYWPYIVAFFAWGCASHAFGAVQDIKADREASIKSVATFLGAKRTVRMSLVLYLAAIAALVYAGSPAIFMIFPALLYLVMVAPFLRLADKDCEKANRGWRKFLLINQISGLVATIILIVVKIRV